ncbi:Secretagogin, partial [Struthio camelus australis]
DNGYIEGKELDNFFHHLLEKLEPEVSTVLQLMKEQFMSTYDVTADGRLQIQEVYLPQPPPQYFFYGRWENRELEQTWETGETEPGYDADSSGFISAGELKDFLRDLFLQHNKMVAEVKLEEYTDTMVRKASICAITTIIIYISLFRILALQENFLLQFKMDACSTEERRRDFEKIFAHYDVSKTGALEGPEVDGFVKDMMELVKPSISGVDLDKFRQILLNHCDVNKDGKIQKSELALCLGLKTNP